jgi:hypothetical protein
MAATQNEFSNALLSAMNAVGSANANAKEATLVVEAEITAIIDEGLGTYKVKYLGNIFEASTANDTIKYEEGDLVYIVVPNGNFDKPKVILSPVTPSTAVYASTRGGTSYITIGDNLFKSVADVELCTYKPHDADPSGSDPTPIVNVDTTGFGALFMSALKDSRTFNFSCTIQTNIDKSRRSRGNYGLVLDIPVIQEVNGVSIAKYYSVVMDINNITGDPYNMQVPALQNFYFTIPDDMEYNDSLSPRIRSFVTGFIGEDSTKPNDIFIRDIKVLSTLAVEEDEMTGYYALITATGGNSFLASRTGDSKTLSVTAYLNGKVTKVNKFECYWFKENVTIEPSSDKFQKFGGIGWEILNPVTNVSIDDDGKQTYQYNTAAYNCDVYQTDIHCDTRFKCVLVKGEDVISTTTTIKNLASTANLELTTVTGSPVFSQNTGNAELVLKYYESGITNVAKPNFTVGYAWQRLDKKGNYIDNDFYTIDKFNEKKNNILYTQIHYPVSEIDEANTVACTVYIETTDGTGVKRQIIGTVWLTLTIGEAADARVVVTNGDKLYKYDADGDAPTVADYDGPLSSRVKVIDPISVAVFKADGSELTADEYKVVNITWLVPIESMITVTQTGDTTSNPGYYTIKGTYNVNHTLSYDIKNTYNKNKLDNTIIVKASAPSAVLTQEISNVANIRFIKDGESGTNGSKYSAVLTYGGYGYGEKDSGGKVHKLQLVYVADRSAWYIYNPASPTTYTALSQVQLGVTLYADGERASTTPIVEWSIFDGNRSYANDKIISPVNVSTGGVITPSGQRWTDTSNNFCATIQAKVKAARTSTLASQTDSDEYVYTYYPIECSYVQSYSLLKSCVPTLQGGYSSVLYAGDGTNPKFDNSEPFYATDAKHDGDIGNLYDYTWSASSNMKVENSTGPNCKVTPTSKYDNGVAKNFVRIHMSRSAAKTSQIQSSKTTAENARANEQNRLSYYQMLQSNLDIFANFDYNSYVNQLKSAAKFYSAKTNLVKTSEQMIQMAERLASMCNRYMINERGQTDNKIRQVLSAVQSKLSTLARLADLSHQLGTTSGVIAQIRAIAPSSLIIGNKISYDNGVPARDCYFTINDLITRYDDTVNKVYSTYYSALSTSDITNYDSVVQSVMNACRTFANSYKLSNLTTSYNGVNEEAYRYSALVTNLQSWINSAGEQVDTYSYNLVIENVLKPMYNAIKYYIDFYRNGGYNSTIRDIQISINTYTNTINELADMLLSANSVYIIHVKPIIMLYNRYEMSHLNGWDGNKLEMGDGYLIAPQVGAGKKNSDNSFTGIVMGVKQIQEKSTSQQKIGMFGYSSGVQSMFLNAEDGSALFGRSGAGQIIIDPSQSKGLLYSANFWKTYNYDGKPSSYGTGNYAKEGMLIDLTTPEIRFGNGNFSVDKDGNLVAAGSGRIAGWKIDDSKIYSDITESSGRITLDSGAYVDRINTDGSKHYTSSHSGKIYSHSHSTLEATTKGFYLSQDGLSISDTIRISTDDGGKVEVGRLTGSRHWTINGSSSESYIAYNTTSFNSSGNNVYIGTDGISLNEDKFWVKRTGELYSTSGHIGGWEISKTKLEAEGITINSNGNISGDGGSEGTSWSITRGKATFQNIVAENKGKIAGWTISSDRLTGGNLSLRAEGSIYGPNWHVTSGGQAKFDHITCTSTWNFGSGTATWSNSGFSFGMGGYGSIASGGFSLAGGGTTYGKTGMKISEGTTTLGGKNVVTRIKELSVESLNVASELIFQGVEVKWQSIRCITKRKMEWTNNFYKFVTGATVTKDSNGKVTDVMLSKTPEKQWVSDLNSTSWYRDLYILTNKGSMIEGCGEKDEED